MYRKLLVSFLIGIIILLPFANSYAVKAATTDQNSGSSDTTTTTPTTNTPTDSTSPTGTTWYNQSFQEWYNKVYDINNPSEIFGERYTAAQVQWVIYSLFGVLINSVTGPQMSSAVQCFLTNSGDISTCKDMITTLLASGTPIPLAESLKSLSPQSPTKDASLLSLVFATNRPISGIAYVKEKLQKLNPVTEVHAATTVGFGYTALQSIQQMWMATRNFAFALFVIAAIIMAFMVMFRVKISPQVVITVQSAIPKIIVALILVTFSYAIAGFLIDLMYVVIGFISLFIPTLLLGTAHSTGFTSAQAFNWLTLGPMSRGIIVSLIIYLVFFIIMLLVALVVNLGAVGIATGIGAIGGIAATGIGAAIGGILGSVSAFILPVILVLLLIIVVVHMFKIWWALIKAFVSVILLTIVAPLQIAAGIVVPNFGFNAWLKSFLAALSTFVVTSLLMYLSFVFLVQAWFLIWNTQTLLNLVFGTGITPTILTSFGNGSAAWPPLIGGGNSNDGVALLFVGVSFVLFTLIPKANQIVQSFITGKPFAYGTALGETLSPIGFAYNQTARPFVEGARRSAGENAGQMAATFLKNYKTEHPGSNLERAPSWFTSFINKNAK